MDDVMRADRSAAPSTGTARPTGGEAASAETPPVSTLPTIGEVVRRADDRLSRGAWNYGQAGAGEEVTVERNRAAWRQLGLVPSVLRDVGHVDTSTTFLGLDLDLPVMCAPVGSLAVFHPEGAAASAEGAAHEGTVGVIGVLSSPVFSEVQARSAGRNLFQVYVSGDERWLDALLERVTDAGAAGICVTVDSPVHARRDRLLEGDFDWRFERDGVPPNLAGLGRDRSYQARLTWRALERLRSRTELPLVVKGIMTPGDAGRAVDIGAQAVYVSNHGGRELDHGLSTIEVLEEIVDAVHDRAEVAFDSGVHRGTDVCKAIALGARAVLIGRLQCWGLAAGGAEGVAQVLRLLRAEIENTMAMVGASTLDELTSTKVRRTVAV